MKAPYNQCIECDDIITNPVCPDCLTHEMRVFVGEHDMDLANDISSTQIYGETTCISCKQPMGLCAHCFSRDIYHQINDKNPQLAQEFMGRFDFDLRVALD